MKLTFNSKNYIVVLLFLTIGLFSCNSYNTIEDTINAQPNIYPDYKNIIIPNNIAPLSFMIKDAQHIEADFSLDKKVVITAKGKEYLEYNLNEWEQFLKDYKGKTLLVKVKIWNDQHPKGASYKEFPISISKDDINPWISYRLIPPGYEHWKHMGIYERCLTNFEESSIVTNEENHNGCVNCHSYCNYSPKNFMFHARSKNGGTVIVKDNKPEILSFKAITKGRSGTYPFWHPSGKYIVYSTNTTRQSFYGFSKDKIEVYDLSSDLMFYNVEKKSIYFDPRFDNKNYLETFPAFSPKGDYLYFCSSKTYVLPLKYDSLMYSICRVPFNVKDGTLGAKVDTIYSAYKQKGSASFPRISPDGNKILFTEAACATFPIHHKEAQLRMIDLKTNEYINTDKINSEDVDSYHSWSSNGKWVIFSSKRLDGRYTRLFITHYNNGEWSKPFLLPQEDPRYNNRLLYSYNIPEFMNGKVELSKKETADLFK